MQDDWQERFSGIERLYGKDSLQLFEQQHIAVIGLGGVGSWVVEALARTAFGKMTLIDYDDIGASNVNRQLHSLTEHFGKKKGQVLLDRVAQINPRCQCTFVDDYINMDNMQSYLESGFDYVVDAIDSISFKTEMIYYCRRNKIPIITIGGAGGVTDPTSITIGDLNKTHNDALAAKVRSLLRHRYAWTNNSKRSFRIDCVYSTQQKRYPKEDGSVSFAKPGVHGVNLDCRYGYGAASFVTASFAFAAVARIVDKILKKNDA